MRTSAQVLNGKYRLDGVIGEGGMGVVHRAEHIELGVTVAVKLLKEEHVTRGDIVERLMREARTAARLRSEHAARVLDVGRTTSGAPFVVMEHLEGTDLAQLLQEHGPLLTEAAVSLILQASEAVAEAHALGIVHRDLKPENLYLTMRSGGEPIVKVLDFGIAKPVDMPSDRSLTNPGAVVGSPDYLAPEGMKRGGRVEATADVWSLGAVLYELVTGHRPFAADGAAETCARVLRDEPTDVRLLAPDVPDGVAQVIARCLSKRPADRYPGVGELARALAPHGSAGAAQQAERVRRIAEGQRPDDVGVVRFQTASGIRLRARVDASELVTTSRFSPEATTPAMMDPATTASRAAVKAAALLVVMLGGAGAMAFALSPAPTSGVVVSRLDLLADAARPPALAAAGAASSSPDAPEDDAPEDDPPVPTASPSPPPDEPMVDVRIAEREKQIAALQARLAREMGRAATRAANADELARAREAADTEDLGLSRVSPDELYQDAERASMDPAASPSPQGEPPNDGQDVAAFRTRH